MKNSDEIPYHSTNFGPLRAYQFPALGDTVHGVFTRLGGESAAPWQSLNMGNLVGDNAQTVRRNFDLACAALDISPGATVSCRQIHGNTVLVAEKSDDGPLLQGKADALISDQPGVILTLRFADCTPLLFFDPMKQAVGLAHAGWRGTMQNVAGATMVAMTDAFDSHPADVRMVIGPAIGPCCYEVGDDVWQAAQTAFAQPESVFVRKGNRRYFDMWQANAQQAKEAGIEQVIVSGLCTACHTDEFFSHRAEEGKTGRFAAFLGLPVLERDEG